MAFMEHTISVRRQAQAAAQPSQPQLEPAAQPSQPSAPIEVVVQREPQQSSEPQQTSELQRVDDMLRVVEGQVVLTNSIHKDCCSI